MAMILKFSKKFLCIDDDRTMLLLTKRVITGTFPEESLEYTEAHSGEEGLEKVRQLNPDIVLSDIHMPGLDGFDVCRQIRSMNPRAAIILTSAYDSEEDNAIKAKEAGADAYLSKPIKKGELLFVINFILRVAHLNDTVFEKNKQLMESLERVKKFHQKLTALNEELRSDKKRMDVNLREMGELNSRLEAKNAQITTMMEEVTHQFDSTVSLVANIIELNRSENRGHAERVGKAAVFIAERSGLSDYQVQNIKTAALLHELGIVGLPIKKKEIALDEGRARLQSQHPLVAEMLLKAYPGFEMVADIIRHLHENVDGSGSPDGLYGDSIPIGARIVSAASYFDHLLSANSQMKAAGVLGRMEEKKNIIFDEEILDLLREYTRSQDTSQEEKTMDCSVYTLEEGMELASDLYSESGINLLRRGTTLNRETLSKILKFHNVDPLVGPIKIKQN